MHYIVQKPFSFAGDSYSPGEVFPVEKYPFVCNQHKLEVLVKSRFVVEDFRVVNRPAPVVAPVYAETSQQEPESGVEGEKMTRSKGAE